MALTGAVGEEDIEDVEFSGTLVRKGVDSGSRLLKK
jgi:hypothetical protein